MITCDVCGSRVALANERLLNALKAIAGGEIMCGGRRIAMTRDHMMKIAKEAIER